MKNRGRSSVQHLSRYCRFFVGATGLLLCQAVMAACLCSHTPATLVDVLDGNTMALEIKGEQKIVHLAGIITPRLAPEPASKDNWCEAEGVKALQAREYAGKLLSKASEITLAEQQTNEAGELSAVVYVDKLSLSQELLYKYLAVEKGERTNWCD